MIEAPCWPVISDRQLCAPHGASVAGVCVAQEAVAHELTEIPLLFCSCIIMIRTEDEMSRNVGESQPLLRF
eukprot:COSAG01_NODE_5377_length_4298_cov_2.455347_7_plen_71_part_00